MAFSDRSLAAPCNQANLGWLKLKHEMEIDVTLRKGMEQKFACVLYV
jgi:hypothetical protein